MKPNVEPLAYRHRKILFIFLLTAFVLSFPVFMFYAAGYRYDFFAEEPTITATGGLYIAAEVEDSTIFLNELEVKNARVFRNASYIQGLPSGLNRVHVQAPNRHTWVKNLSVYPHIVTEAESFNLPLVPQIRPVTRYQTTFDEAVIFANATNTPDVSFASSSIPFYVSTSTATSTYSSSQEFSLLNNLFVEQASTTRARLANEAKFGFSTSTIVENNIATTTVVRDNLRLYQDGEDIFVQIIDENKKVPHYFCENEFDLSLNSRESGLVLEKDEVMSENSLGQISGQTLKCRSQVKIDRKWQKVHSFDFFPENEDLVLMNLDEGVYVVEIDDRSWQNVQLLYPGKDLSMLVYGGRIFIKDKDLIVEALTEIPVQ